MARWSVRRRTFRLGTSLSHTSVVWTRVPCRERGGLPGIPGAMWLLSSSARPDDQPIVNVRQELGQPCGEWMTPPGPHGFPIDATSRPLGRPFPDTLLAERVDSDEARASYEPSRFKPLFRPQWPNVCRRGLKPGEAFRRGTLEHPKRGTYPSFLAATQRPPPVIF